ISRQSVAFAPTAPLLLDTAALPLALASGEMAAVQHALHRNTGGQLAGTRLSQAPGFESWLLLERQRWDELRLHALQTLLDHYERVGALSLGIAAGRQGLEVGPGGEEAHRQLMRLLARAGQRAQALVQYERCRSALARELGVAPQEATTALYERLRRGMGGSGKTLLARAVAAHFLRPESLADSAPFSDGVFMVELANLRDPHNAG